MGSAWRALAGQVIDEKYVLYELAGERDNRATFIAEQSGSNSAVIVEILPGDSPEADRQQSRWSIARDLSHSNLVRILDTGRTTLNGATYVYGAKERPDDALAEVIRNRVLAPEEARDVAAAILPCLEYLHTNGLVHGAVETRNVLACGDHVKLAADTIAKPEKASAGSFAQDMYGVGVVMVEMLTGKRPAPGESTVGNGLPSPLREIAIGCLEPNESQRWTARQALDALEATPLSPAPDSEPRKVFPLGLVLVLSAAVIAAFLLVRTFQHHEPEKQFPAKPADTVVKSTPAPKAAPEIPPPSAVSEQPANPPETKPAPTVSPGWAVIAATYKDFDAAQKRANSIHRKFDEFACTVYPPRGKGSYYFVLLGSGLTQDGAVKLKQQARTSGLPGDTYITKLTRPKGDTE